MASSHGIVEHPDSPRPTDYLFRVSLKCVILDSVGEVLVVKERGRDCWDLPGGGMDHGETLATAIARELREEVSMQCAFSFQIITAEDPAFLKEHDWLRRQYIPTRNSRWEKITPHLRKSEGTVGFLPVLGI